MAKKSAKKSVKKATKRSATKRELLTPRGADKRYAKRAGDGTWTEMDDVSRSLAGDRRRSAKTAVKPGHGDQGDAKRVVKRAAKKR